MGKYTDNQREVLLRFVTVLTTNFLAMKISLNHLMRRWLLTALSMPAVFLFSQTAVAPSGTGTSGDPYLISSLDNLYWVSQNSASWASGKYFQQTTDIDASGTSSWFSGAGFVPIGNISSRFYANYNGLGHSISGLTINRSGSELGLFGYCQGGTIENLTLISPNITYTITGTNGAGVLSGGAYLATFDHINIQGGTLTTTGAYTYAGPLLGRGASVTISNCQASTTVDHSYGSNVNSGLGGLIGYIDGTFAISDSYATGSVTKTGGNRTGGFVGVLGSGGTVDRCYATGNVTGVNEPGGFVGNAYGCAISNCYATGNVYGSASDGKGTFAGFSQSGTVFTNCYGTGTLSGYSGGWTGGFSGYTQGATFNNCFWDKETSGYTNAFGYSSSNTGTPVGETTANMKTNSNFTDATWDFYGESVNGTDEIWDRKDSENSGYPYLKGADVWIGVTSTDWNTTSNWKSGEIPLSTASVSIPAGCTYYPVLTQNEAVKELSLDGTITTAGNTMTVGVSASTSGAFNYVSGYVNGTLRLWVPASTTGALTFPMGNGTYLSIATVTFTGAPTTGGTLTGTLSTASNGNSINLDDSGTTLTQIADGYLQIEAGDGLSGGTYDMSLTTNYIYGVSDVTALRIVKRADAVSPWTVNGTHSTGTGPTNNPTAHRTGMSGFSQFAMASPPVNTLPVELSDFYALCETESITVGWTTASERNSAYFLVESLKNEAWVPVAKVDGAGNSNQLLEYRISDEKTTLDNYYRLVQVDLDGAETVYGPISIQCESTFGGRVYPNPAKDIITFSGLNYEDGIPAVHSMRGTNVNASIQIIEASGTELTVNISQLAPGMYYLPVGGSIVKFVKE